MIKLSGVAKYYGAHAAVEALDLHVAEGEVVGLLGLNGAGKTTVLRMLAGLLVPSVGRVVVGGFDTVDAPEQARKAVGFLPDTPPLYRDMTVRDYLSFALHIRCRPKNALAMVDRALTMTDLLDVQHLRIDVLSHGYHRRIGIAQAVVHGPEVILLDEPTSGLDPLQVVQMRQLIRGLRGRNTLLISSHLLTEIHALCDRIVVLHEGRVAASGTEAELSSTLYPGLWIHIEVRAPRGALEDVLSHLPFVLETRLEAPLDRAVLRAALRLEGDRREALARALIEHGLGLVAMHEREDALEQTFLRLTGQHQAPNAPMQAATRAASEVH